MSKFAIDLLSGKVFMLAGDFTSSGDTPTSGATYPVVNQYLELPTPASAYVGQIYIVRIGEGEYIANRKDAGLYYSNGLAWVALPTVSAYFNSNNFEVYDSVDHTKGLSFITSGITSNNFRKLKVQNSDGVIAYLSDVGLKVDTSLFNVYTGDTETTINSKLDVVAFSAYTGTTLSNFNLYTGTTLTKFDNYTGSTEVIINKTKNYVGNGIISGFTITINVDNKKINISAGAAYFINNYINVLKPVSSTLLFTGKTGIVLTNLNADIATYLAVNSSGVVIQQATQFTEAQRRDYVLIGAAIHSDKTSVNAVNNLPDVVLSSTSQFNDLLDSLKNFNKEGNIFSPNGANLSINKSIGKIFKRGSNFIVDPKNPHVKELAALTAPSNIRYRLSNGVEYADTNVISLYYESSPGVRTALPGSDFSIQRIVVFPSNLIRIQYGQSKYNTMALAKQAILIDPFVVERNITENGLLRGYLIVAGRTTSLLNTNDAIFIEVDKFGTMPMGSTGGITTLQQSYENSVIPQITTTSTLGALTIKNGGTGNTVSVLNIQNTSGVTTSKFTGDGTIILPKTSGIGIKVDSVNPTYGWRDLIGIIRTRTGGATVPTFAPYIGSIYQYSFGTAAGADEVFNEYHILHDYAPNTDMFIHTHWSTIAAPTGDVNWMFDISYAKGYNQEAFQTPVTIPVTQTSSTAYTHRIAEVQMSAPNGVISSPINVSITSGNATLTSTSALFTSADIGRTVRIAGAGVAGGNLDTTIASFSSSTSVTVGNNASTTVTNQPNFKYRVINTSLLEIDGMLLVRTWRDSARTADTLNVAPFLHFVDIHYQSTLMSTKNKNYPFYT